MSSALKNSVKFFCIGTVSVGAIGFLPVGVADADTYVPLPDGEIAQTLDDGTIVTIRGLGQSANISPSMGATPVHRNVMVSGKATVELQGGHVVGTWIYPGYVVGCQVDISGGGVGGNAGLTGMAGQNGSLTGNAGANGMLTLGPGQAVSYPILDLEYADAFGNPYHDVGNFVVGSSGSVSWTDETIGLTGCAGYAQARSFVNVEVETDKVISLVTLWGAPFSIG